MDSWRHKREVSSTFCLWQPFPQSQTRSRAGTCSTATLVYDEWVATETTAPAQAHSRLHLKTYILIAIMVVAGPIGNLLIAMSMKQAGQVKLWPPSELLPTFTHVFGSLTIWVGIASLITFIVAYMLALSMADYSFVQPAAALGYGVVAALGYFVLHESVSPLRWAGIAVICFGVAFIRNTHPRTTENPN